MVDQTALRFNQGAIIGLLAIAFLLDQWALVALVMAVMVVGTLWPAGGLFKQIYARIVKPRGWLRPRPVAEDPQPHLFAQGLGGIFLAVALALSMAGWPVVGWFLVWTVIALAAVNLLFDFCLGCFFYFQLARRGVRAALPWWEGGAGHA